MPIVIEVAGGSDEVASHVRRALRLGKHLVTANKSLLAVEGPHLFDLARRHHVAIAFEASCAAGLPIITALQFGLSANRIDGLYGILNGTCNFILTQMTRNGISYEDALQQAQELGYAEADPTLDVSGQDAAQKLTLLASLSFGINATENAVWFEGIDRLDLSDIQFGAELGYDIKLLAIARRDSQDHQALSLRVHPAFVHNDLPLAQVRGPFNALSVYGHATGHTMYYGRGAGQMPTASAIVSDLVNMASGWYPTAFIKKKLWSGDRSAMKIQDRDELVGRYYLRMSTKDVPGVVAQVSKILGDSGISLSALLQHEMDAGQFVPVVILTHKAREGSLMRALADIEKLEVINGEPVCIRIVDLPEE